MRTLGEELITNSHLGLETRSRRQGREGAGDSEPEDTVIIKQLGGQALGATPPESWLHPDQAT